LPRRTRWVRASIASPSVRPSPYRWRVGIRIFTFEACSGFTHITARWIARPPKATFVTRLQCDQLPSHPARQLPDLSTTIWVDSSSTGDTRPSGHTAISGVVLEWSRMSLRSSGLRIPGAPILPRHCERSEAIHSFFMRRDGLLRFARNDDRHTFAFSRRGSPELCIFVCPPRHRGGREDRVLAAPAVSP